MRAARWIAFASLAVAGGAAAWVLSREMRPRPTGDVGISGAPSGGGSSASAPTVAPQGPSSEGGPNEQEQPPPTPGMRLLRAHLASPSGVALEGSVAFALVRSSVVGDVSTQIRSRRLKVDTAELEVPAAVADGDPALWNSSTFQLWCRHSVLGDAGAPLERGAREVTFRFEAPAALDVLLQNLPAQALGQVRIAASAAAPHQTLAQRTADGWRLAPLAPGEFDLTVFLEEDDLPGSPQIELHRRRVRIGQGGATEVISLEPLAPLEVFAPEIAAGTTVELARIGSPGLPAGRGARRRLLDAEHRARWRWLPLGTYRVEAAQGKARGETLAVVPEDREVRLTLAEPDALRVVVVDEGGALFHAGLRDGDFVLAIDGIEVTSGAQGKEEIARRLSGQAEIRLRVARGAEELDVRLETAAFAPERLGGQFRPSFRR
ncbi:MAG: PDZ domain-containing protein [Planctomycetes bacterium]|nr:PDZ domain-containing protein [Planctomycetota bacterium]